MRECDGCDAADVSPTPVFGECKKTCDLAAMFVNHQPKRRRYDKRTSSANWGDDGYISPDSTPSFCCSRAEAVRIVLLKSGCLNVARHNEMEYESGGLHWIALTWSHVPVLDVLLSCGSGASFMAEQRFEQQIKLNIAMQNDKH